MGMTKQEAVGDYLATVNQMIDEFDARQKQAVGTN